MLLMSPRFVNHLELAGTPIAGRADTLALDPYEIASRLSYTFWQTLPTTRCWPRRAGRLARHRRRVRRAARSRVRRSAHARHASGSSGTSGCASRSFTGFSSDRPAFMALAAGENLGVAGHDHWGDMVQEIHDLTDSTPGPARGRSRDLLTSDLSVTKSGRSRAPLRRAGLERQRRLPALHRRQPAPAPAARGAARDSLEQTNPFHRGAFIRRSILCDNLPRARPEQPAAGLARSAAAAPGDDHAPALRRPRWPATACARRCHSSFSNLGYVMEAYDALGRFRTREKVFDEQTGALLADAAHRHQRRPAGDRRRHARRSRARPSSTERIIESGKVEACLSAQLLPLRPAPPSDRDSADACDTRRWPRPGGRRARSRQRSGGSRTSAGFRQHKGARREVDAIPAATCCAGAGGAVLALPFLESLAPRTPRARPPRRRSGSSC